MTCYFKSFLQSERNYKIRGSDCSVMMMPAAGKRGEASVGMMMSSVVPVMPDVVMSSVIIPVMVSVMGNSLMSPVMISFMGNSLLVVPSRRRSRFPAARRPETDDQRHAKHDCRNQIHPLFHKCHRLSFVDFILA